MITVKQTEEKIDPHELSLIKIKSGEAKFIAHVMNEAQTYLDEKYEEGGS